MFQDTVIVNSAVSAFNNAAIIAPAFFWNAVLCLPLFIGVYLFGRFYSKQIGFDTWINPERVGFWVVTMVALWIVLMGGNYAVLRDGVSLLPFVVAVVLFISCLFIGQRTRAVPLPVWYGNAHTSMKRRWVINIALFLIAMIPVGFSDTLNWWGPILQIGAVFGGLLIGRWCKRQMHAVPFMMSVMFLSSIALLMQPEYFRFGQLGNLTPVHLIGVLMTGILIAAAFAVSIVPACTRIHNSAYIKLKWLVRFGTMLCMVLFLLTEAVPIFIAATFMAFVLFAMSIWHSKSVDSNLAWRMVAMAITMFGILIEVPTVSVLGIFWISVLGLTSNQSDARFLL